MVFSGNGKKVKFSDFFTFLLFEFLNFLPFAKKVSAGGGGGGGGGGGDDGGGGLVVAEAKKSNNFVP